MKNYNDTLKKNLKGEIDYELIKDIKLKNFIKKMTQKDPKNRFNSIEAYTSEYFLDLNLSKLIY